MEPWRHPYSCLQDKLKQQMWSTPYQPVSVLHVTDGLVTDKFPAAVIICSQTFGHVVFDVKRNRSLLSSADSRHVSAGKALVY